MKEKSQARQKDIDKKRREQAARKQAEAEARQQLLREEREQQVRLKREEEHIQKEMTKIRRVMEEEKKTAKEKLDRCDQYITSPYNINRLLSRQVIRIKKIINQKIMF